MVRVRVIVVNRSRNAVLGARVRRADGFLRRLKGLLGSRALPEGEGLWIVPCEAVHTIGMRYPIDVLFLDAYGRATGCCRGLAPNRFSPRFRGARGALELPAGTLARTSTREGDVVSFGEPSASNPQRQL
jgi:uncharacterized membrane protein (UPF0127 family)